MSGVPATTREEARGEGWSASNGPLGVCSDNGHALVYERCQSAVGEESAAVWGPTG
ncbi:hypothetical protein VNI00_016205 [Paramarasmius palmivorus]|uniref:Uncharacterized protein n=1 Tax=Paramarasmius palmivorus TaxID=297713 RepID=A0AAW0BFC8_9AGAR